MTMKQFREGERIRIAASYHWAQGATGTIAAPPEIAQQLETGHPWQGLTSRWKGPTGKVFTRYWVWFDEPQNDVDGDGPYKGGGIDVDAIESLE